MRSGLGPALLAFALGLFPFDAWAQRGAAPGDFDFYVLALSWSPGYCALEGERRGSGQCEPGRRLGFVVHGLWPQNERGSPSDCDVPERQPSRAALAEAEGVFPEQGLARYQWRKHGSCSGLAPADYYRAARQARDKVRIPDALAGERPARSIVPRELERLFAAANPGLRPDMMAVSCRRGQLQEVRVCLTRDLRSFRPCPQVDRSGCSFGEVEVAPPR